MNIFKKCRVRTALLQKTLRSVAPFEIKATRWRSGDTVFLLDQPNGVISTDPAGLQHGCIDSDVDRVVLCRGAQDADIFREISLCKGSHYTTRAVLGDVKAHVVPNGKVAADPAVFHEIQYVVRCPHHDIGPKAPDFESSLGI